MADYFTRTIIVERGTIPHQCAIDSGMILIHTDHDMLTYHAEDNIAWQEYRAYTEANKAKIRKEEQARYKY